MMDTSILHLLKEFLIYEGLTFSTSREKLAYSLRKDFPTNYKSAPNNSKIFMIFNNIENIDKVLRTTQVHGWFPSFYSTDIKSSKYKDNTLPLLKQQLLNRDIKYVVLTFEARFDVEVPKNQVEKTIYYHITPKPNWEKIKKIGLTPKSKSQRTSHPSRVYLTKDPDLALDLSRQMITRGQREWVLLKVDPNFMGIPIRIFYDPNMQGGFYTLNNIPPGAITKIKDVIL